MLDLTIFRREQSAGLSATAIGLLIALVVLIVLISVGLGVFFYLRRRRNRSLNKSTLPLYNEKRLSSSSSSSGAHRRVLVRPSESVLVYQEKKNLLDNSTSPPDSPLPEIRITFPEEYDDSGKRTSGRVVVVRIGDSSFGLEPVAENLPAYQQGERFQSIDLERVGGLQEKVVAQKQWS